MKASERFRYVVLAAMICLGAVALFYSRAIESSQEVVARTMRYDVAWPGVNGRLELARLEKYIANFVVSLAPADADAATLAYQIVLARLQTLGSGDFRHFLDLAPERRAKFERLRSILTGIAVTPETLSDPVARKTILKNVADAGLLMDRIGTEAHTSNVAETARLRDDLTRKQQLQVHIFTILFVVGVILILLTLAQNKSLTTAYRVADERAEEFAYLAHHDPLTGLQNRAAFGELRQSAVDERIAEGKVLAVLAIDLDGFKAINDTLGHAAGDYLLASIARRLQQAVSNGTQLDAAFRLGGDEFVLLLAVKDSLEAAARARALLRLLHEPHHIANGTVIVDATIGIACSETSGRDLETTHADADLALNHAKSLGKGIAVEYDHTMRNAISRRNKIETDLKLAVSSREIVPYYQPQVDLKTGRLIGVEALARWKHSRLGWVSPAEFIPIAESSGQIFEIGRLMLEAACRDAAAFPAVLPVAVNLSVAQLVKDDVVDLVSDVLNRNGLAPSRLKLEVTETVVMRDAERSLATLRRLQQLGVAIALDDFGTGYSALSYLREFAWDELKIDRGFTASIGNGDSQGCAIVRAVISLASTLNVRVTAEGIENDQQLELLKDAGCTNGQGYLFSKPVPADDIARIVDSERMHEAAGLQRMLRAKLA